MSCTSASARLGQEAMPAAGPSAPSTMMPSLHSINEEGAMRILAEMLDALDTHGLALFSGSGQGAVWPLSSPTTWSSALAVLSTSAPLNAMVADTLLERVSAALSVEIGVYNSAVLCCSGPLSTEVALPALERLGEVYRHVHSHLLRWCSTLHTPGVAALLAVRLRRALLQTDLVTGEEPPGRQALFSFLRQHGRFLLAKQRKTGGDDGDEDADSSECDGTLGEAGGVSDCTLAPGSASPAPDSLMACLHRLSLNRSAEVKQLWRSVLEDGIRDRLSDLSDDFSTRILHKHLSWLEHSVVPFVRMVLPDSDGESEPFCRSSGNLSGGTSTNQRCGDAGMTSEGRPTVPGRAQGGDACPSSQTSEMVRAEREAWCADLRLLLLHTYARRRLDGFWEILSDYPDSVPALEDMHYCLQSTPESGLKTELVQTVRHLLSSRLHRAGTRTDDILAILINTIHAFCILFPRNEQSSVVFSVTSDTLEHLRRRKDCVPAVVQAVMQPGGAMNVAPPPLTQAASEGLVGSLDFDADAGGKEGELHRAASRDQPDVVRVLLTSIPRRALVDEYQQMLAEQLLQKPMHEFDTTPEEEVLERLRHVFGETALDRCAVMVRDMQMSRRISQQLREQLARSRADRLSQSRSTAVSPAASVSVLSMTTWPPLARCSPANGGDSGPAAAPLKFCPHPALQEEMDALAEAYKRLKDNQRMTWLPSLGRVELVLTQKDPSKGDTLVAVPQVLSLFDASIVLHVKEMASRGGSSTPVHLKEVGVAMEVQLEELRAHAQRLSPAVLVFQPATDLVTMQLSVASSADFVFMEDREPDEESGKPAGLPPERVKLMERMVTSLLKTRGAQSSTAIHSSLKLLGKFEGSNADVVELLRSFVGRGLIVLNDARQYALPPKSRHSGTLWRAEKAGLSVCHLDEKKGSGPDTLVRCVPPSPLPLYFCTGVQPFLRMALPLAARQHFLEHGYAIVPDVLSTSMVERIRSGALASTTARFRSFAHLPNVHSLLKSTPKCTDPLQDGLESHLQKRRYILRYYRDMRRHKRRLRRAAKAFLNDRDVSELGREDMLKLSEIVSAEAQRVWSRGCTSTVKTDPQMLMAIDQYRANAWMTNAQLEAVLRDKEGFVKPLSQLAEVVGGVARPVIFGDVPLLREAYGNPVGYHCLAPTIGTRTNARVSKGGGEATAVSMVLFTYTPTPLCLPPFVMSNSQHAVRRQYLHSVRAERLWRPFAPMEADIRDQLRRFQFDASVVGQPLLAGMAGSSSTPAAPVIGPGTVMVVDPHLMMAFGGNMTPQSEVIYRINVVSENAQPHLMAPSWIRGWRTMPQEVHFASPVVFPLLYVE